MNLLLLLALPLVYTSLPIAKRKQTAISLAPSVSDNPLIDDKGLILTVPAYLGNPESKFEFIVDISSLSLWVESSSCSKCFNAPHNFNPKHSLTFKYLYLQYGDVTYNRCQYRGNISSDFFSLYINGSLASTRVNFTLATYTNGCSKDNFDGTLGLGKDHMYSVTPIIELLKNAHEISSAVFAIYLNNFTQSDETVEPSSVLEIGSVNLTYYSSNPSSVFYMPASFEYDTWEVQFEKVYLGDWLDFGNITVEFSTLIPYFIGDIDFYFMYYSFFATIGLECKTTPNIFAITCDENPTVELPGMEFIIGNNSISLKNDTIWSCAKKKCLLLFDFKVSGYWIFGQKFFENYYTIFNYDNNSMGFAPSLPAKIHKDSLLMLSVSALVYFALS